MSAPDRLLAAPARDEGGAVETWRPIPGWPHEASVRGQVRRIPWIDAAGVLHLGGILAQQADKRPGKGYLYVTLRDGKRRRKAPVAVVVLEAHVGLRPGPEYEACHGNDIRTDNWLVNLSWETKAANLRKMWDRRRAERAVTDTDLAVTLAVTGGGGNGHERHEPKVRAGAGAFPSPSRRGVTSDGPHGTVASRLPSKMSFSLSSVQPVLRSLRSLRRRSH